MWAQLIPIIGTYGLQFAELLFQKWNSSAPPTQADFDQLRALGKQNAVDRMKANLTAAGIPLDDPKAVALLKLTQAQ